MCKYLFLSLVSLLLGMHLEVELLDHVVLCLRNCHTIFHSTLAWKIPWTEESGGLQSMESYTTEQLTTKGLEFEHLLRCILAIRIFSLEKYLFKSFVHILIGLFGFCCCKSSLCILDMNLLSIIFEDNFFSPVKGY